MGRKTRTEQELLGEEWRSLESVFGVGFEGYAVSDRGRVRGRRKTFLTPRINNGYFKVNLFNRETKNTETWALHSLVARVFIGDPPHKYTQIHHIDGDIANNWVSNLEYLYTSLNAIHGNALMRSGVTTREIRQRNRKNRKTALNKLDTPVNRTLILGLKDRFTTSEIAELINESSQLVSALITRCNKELLKKKR
jgi:hypothetical protein